MVENTPDYYQTGTLQPIEIMQEQLTPEQFEGFILGNIIKYSLRYGKKDAKDKEAVKICRYAKWLLLQALDITIQDFSGYQLQKNEKETKNVR